MIQDRAIVTMADIGSRIDWCHIERPWTNHNDVEYLGNDAR